MNNKIIGSNISNPFTLDLDKIQDIKQDEGLLNLTFKNENEIRNLKYILNDLLQGDSSLAKREEYAYLNFKQLEQAIKWIMDNDFDDNFKVNLLTNPHILTFKDKPPTPEEFLTDKYIGVMSESIWHPVKKAFLEYFDPLKPYRTAALNPAIGAGKFFLLDEKLKESEKKWFYMGDAKIGQNILTPFGQSKISAIHPQGVKPIYKIKTSDGQEIKCGLEHLWTVTWQKDINGNKIWRTVDTKFLLENKSKYKFEIPSYERKAELNSADSKSFRTNIF